MAAIWAALFFSSCTPLLQGEGRKITMYGVWAAAYGGIVGIGYLHTERGPNVKSEESDKPSDAVKNIVVPKSGLP